MKLSRFISDPYTRIKTTHIVASLLLLVNAVIFTDNIVAIVIQLIIASLIMLHDLDDEHIKQHLISSENQLREETNIFDRNVIVSETDLKGVIKYANSNYLKVTGYKEDELINFTHAKIKGDETKKAIHDNLWNTLRSDKTFTGIMKNKKKDGTPFWVNVHISPIFINSKKTGYKSIMFDITDEILAQENLKNTIEDKDLKLQEQTTKFEFAINSSRDGFWDYDLIEKEFYLSNGWKKRLGFSDDTKITYLDYLSLMPDKYRFEHHKAMHDLIEQYHSDVKYIHFRIKYPIVTKDGEKLNIEDVGDIFFDGNQNPIRITGFHRDITEQERQTKIIESQNRLAAMGEMMSNIAHQWRQPIGAINNTLNDLEFDIELEDMKSIDSKVFLETSSKVKELTAHLSQTIDDFRKVSSDEKVKSTFLVGYTIEQAYSILENEYEKNSIKFQLIKVGDNLPELDGYSRELQQVLINLLNNAKDILLEKKIINPTVIVSVSTSDNEITIIVQDNGGGIPNNVIEKIFDPYFTTKHESIGTGIGLYMSKKIITQYFDGSIEVENENGGAKFIIILPKI